MARCSGPNCGAEIEWGISPSGAKVPLTRISHAYWGDPSEAGKDGIPLKVVRRPDDKPQMYVSHFLVCPDAGRFSGRGRSG